MAFKKTGYETFSIKSYQHFKFRFLDFDQFSQKSNRHFEHNVLILIIIQSSFNEKSANLPRRLVSHSIKKPNYLFLVYFVRSESNDNILGYDHLAYSHLWSYQGRYS